ncbi:MAG TPA: peptidoglycan DD-metalloendopeptidase family protein [Leptolyngbyaceae cyanobacterium]
MKRAIPQEPTNSHSSLESAPEGAKAGLPGNHRRVRTSAAMLGLAISVGASGTLLCQTEGAAAADQMAEPMLLAAALPPNTLAVGDVGSPSASYHTIREGESLWQIAQAHRVDVQAIKSANGISSEEVLKVGQVIRIPAASEETTVAASVKTADLAQDDAKLPTSDAEALVSGLQEAATTEGRWSEAETASQAIASAALPSGQTEKIETAQEASTPLSSLPSSKAADLAEAPDVTWLSRSVESVDTAPEAEVAAESLGEQAAPQSVPSPSASAAKRIQHLAALSNRLEESETFSQPVVPVVPSSDAYRVKPGDTIWTIASRYGVQPEALIQANGVRDPNLIVVGDLIQIPAEAFASSGGRHSTALAAPATPVEAATASARIARVSGSSSNSVDRAQLYERIRQARQSLNGQRAVAKEASAETTDVATLPQSLPLNESSPAAEQRDPHVANLIAEIRSMQRQSTVAIAPSNSEQPTQLAAVTSLRNSQGGAVEAAPTNPEFAPETAPQSKPAAPAPELLAAAPLSPEAYAPVMDMPTGRTVSPDLPILPGASEYLPEAPDRFNGYVWPARGVLTSGYGPRWGRMHRGVDIAGPVGTPIFAAASGVVVRAGWNSGGYGNLVDIQHPDGSLTRYGHNSRLLVRAGQQVRQGEQIAEMGSTGYSTGPHLHFEVHLPGTGTVNPIAYLPGR